MFTAHETKTNKTIEYNMFETFIFLPFLFIINIIYKSYNPTQSFYNGDIYVFLGVFIKYFYLFQLSSGVNKQKTPLMWGLLAYNL